MNRYHIKKEYIIHNSRLRRKIRVELISAPLLIIIPLAISSFFLYDWFTRGFMNNTSMYNGELIVGLLILLGNIICGIPFIRSVRSLSKEMHDASD
ncbi:MAG: hypothetical protein QXS02_00115 [Candidatus Thermoplasmatota archaeon]